MKKNSVKKNEKKRKRSDDKNKEPQKRRKIDYYFPKKNIFKKNDSYYKNQPRHTSINRFKNSNKVYDLTKSELDDYILGINEHYEGVNNLGNSCYMSAVISLLRHNKCFLIDLKYVFEMAMDIEDSKIKFKNSFLEEFCHQLLSKDDVIYPKRLKHLLENEKPDFRGSFQQDAHEFIISVFDILKDQCALVIQEYLKKKKTGEKVGEYCPIIRNFKGTNQRTMRCTLPACKATSINDDPFEIISVDFARDGKGIITLNESVRKFFRMDIVRKNCYSCGETGTTPTNTRIVEFPKYLIIHLKRFKLEYDKIKNQMKSSKKHDEIKLENVLRLEGTLLKNSNMKFPFDFVSNSIPNSVDYRLISFIIHRGKGLSQGHYITLTYDEKNKSWNRINDNITKKGVNSPFTNETRKTAYILCFELVGLIKRNKNMKRPVLSTH